MKDINWLMLALYGVGTWGVTSTVVHHWGWVLGTLALLCCLAGFGSVMVRDYFQTAELRHRRTRHAEEHAASRRSRH